MATRLPLEKIEEAVQKSPPEEQRRFLTNLPHLLHISPSDWMLLKLAEESFDFWNNPDDIVYDRL